VENKYFTAAAAAAAVFDKNTKKSRRGPHLLVAKLLVVY
jgi:hypothetical protein